MMCKIWKEDRMRWPWSLIRLRGKCQGVHNFLYSVAAKSSSVLLAWLTFTAKFASFIWLNVIKGSYNLRINSILFGSHHFHMTQGSPKFFTLFPSRAVKSSRLHTKKALSNHDFSLLLFWAILLIIFLETCAKSSTCTTRTKPTMLHSFKTLW